MEVLSGPRVIADCVLRPADFDIVSTHLEAPPVRARKVGFVAARQTKQEECVTTHWNGIETENTAQPGDWIVTNLSPTRAPLRDRHGNLNIYVVGQARFPDLYEPAGSSIPLGRLYRAKSTVLALKLDGGFDILAPWGERQRADKGYLILSGAEVYGNNAETFAATYETLAD